MDSLEYRIRTNFTAYFEPDIESSLVDQPKQLFVNKTELISQNRVSIYSYDFAVVSIVGSVLERILQTLCIQHFQQMPKPQDSIKSAFDSRLFSLEEAGVLDQAIAVKISAWLAMREHILCGRIDHLNRSQISDMVEGTRNFLNASLQDATGMPRDACESLDYADSVLS